MNVEINGEAVVVPDGATTAQAAATTGVDPERRGVAIAIDGEVVPRARWGETLHEGARLEVIHAIQGG
ncbi:MAG: sulfur carrier protein ThiS [Solirubrobacterales bacterium]